MNRTHFRGPTINTTTYKVLNKCYQTAFSLIHFFNYSVHITNKYDTNKFLFLVLISIQWSSLLLLSMSIHTVYTHLTEEKTRHKHTEN